MFFRSHRNTGIILFAMTVLFGCTSALYQPTPENATGDSGYDELIKGRSLYVEKCGSCHVLHLPKEFTGPTWIKNLDEMQVRAGINDAEKTLIRKFIFSDPGFRTTP